MVILFVEDDPVQRRVWGRFLERLGHRCVPASGDEDMIGLCARVKPDMVFSDVDLGDRDGIEMGLEMRGLWPGLSVAIMTGDPASAERARRSGFERVLLKPFSFEELASLLAG